MEFFQQISHLQGLLKIIILELSCKDTLQPTLNSEENYKYLLYIPYQQQPSEGTKKKKLKVE
jgi:hypothetical protein